MLKHKNHYVRKISCTMLKEGELMFKKLLSNQ